MSHSPDIGRSELVCSECGSVDDVEICDACNKPHCASCFECCDGCQDRQCPNGEQVHMDAGFAMGATSFTVCPKCQKEVEWQACAYCDEPIGYNGYEECAECGAKVCPCCNGDSEEARYTAKPLTRCSKCDAFVCVSCIPNGMSSEDLICKRCREKETHQA